MFVAMKAFVPPTVTPPFAWTTAGSTALAMGPAIAASKKEYATSEVAITHVQLDGEPIDDSEGLVRGLHHGKIGGDRILEVERVEVARHLGSGSPVLARGCVVGEPRVPEILLQDETPRLVHDDSAIQAEPHHVGVELVAVREVHILPQGERVVESAR